VAIVASGNICTDPMLTVLLSAGPVRMAAFVRPGGLVFGGRCCRGWHALEESGVAIPGLRELVWVAAAVLAAPVFAGPAPAASPPAPGITVSDEDGKCTAGFAAQDNDGNYYLLTSGHCDAHDGSEWTYGENVPLGRITASENEGDSGAGGAGPSGSGFRCPDGGRRGVGCGQQSRARRAAHRTAGHGAPCARRGCRPNARDRANRKRFGRKSLRDATRRASATL